MAVGIVATIQQVNDMAGTTARAVKVALERVREFKSWLDAQSDADLIALGYTQADVDTLRSAYGDLAHLADVFAGAGTQGVAKDFRAFAKRVWGLGVTNTTT